MDSRLQVEEPVDLETSVLLSHAKVAGLEAELRSSREAVREAEERIALAEGRARSLELASSSDSGEVQARLRELEAALRSSEEARHEAERCYQAAGESEARHQDVAQKLHDVEDILLQICCFLMLLFHTRT